MLDPSPDQADRYHAHESHDEQHRAAGQRRLELHMEDLLHHSGGNADLGEPPQHRQLDYRAKTKQRASVIADNSGESTKARVVSR